MISKRQHFLVLILLLSTLYISVNMAAPSTSEISHFSNSFPDTTNYTVYTSALEISGVASLEQIASGNGTETNPYVIEKLYFSFDTYIDSAMILDISFPSYSEIYLQIDSIVVTGNTEYAIEIKFYELGDLHINISNCHLTADNYGIMLLLNFYYSVDIVISDSYFGEEGITESSLHAIQVNLVPHLTLVTNIKLTILRNSIYGVVSFYCTQTNVDQSMMLNYIDNIIRYESVLAISTTTNGQKDTFIMNLINNTITRTIKDYSSYNYGVEGIGMNVKLYNGTFANIRVAFAMQSTYLYSTYEAVFVNCDIVTLDGDYDMDGLSDNAEFNTYLTDVYDNDTDDDTLSDGFEILTFQSSALTNDTDADLLTDDLEYLHNTNPLWADTDNDTISDGDEVLIYHSSPLSADTDLDGISDAMEVNLGSGLNDTDSDDDGLTDTEEVFVYCTSPTNPDTDNDGISDYDEVVAGSDPNDFATTITDLVVTTETTTENSTVITVEYSEVTTTEVVFTPTYVSELKTKTETQTITNETPYMFVFGFGIIFVSIITLRKYTI